MSLYPPLPDIADLLKYFPEQSGGYYQPEVATFEFKKTMYDAPPAAHSLEHQLTPSLDLNFRVPVQAQLLGYTARRWLNDIGEKLDASKFAQAVAQSEAVPIPAFLENRIHRQAKAPPAEQRPPQTGQIRWLSQIGERPLLHPICFVLDQPISNGGWQVWMVAPEVDYATDRDLLIEEERDGSIDPLAGMVQTWNQFSLKKAVGEAIGQLGQERMELVRQLEAMPPSTDKPRPGHVHLQAIGQDSILCGTPLGGTGDPRRQYQDIYRRLAGRLSTQVR